MGPIGWQEMMAIFVLALILFGPKDMARIGRTVGKAIADFRRASNDLKATFNRELSALEREGQSGSQAAGSIADPSDQSYRYNYGYDAYYDAASTPAPVPSTPAPEGAEPAKIAAPEGTVPAKEEATAPHPAPAEQAGGQSVAS